MAWATGRRWFSAAYIDTTAQKVCLNGKDALLSYNEIADVTDVEPVTVNTHVLLIYKRPGIHNAQEAVVQAKILGILEQ